MKRLFAPLFSASSIRVLAGSIIAATLVIGCALSSSPSADSCTPNFFVACSVGAGYSCTGAAVPDPALDCGASAPGTSGGTDYCCGSATTMCMADSTVTGCTGTASGYSCSGSAPPNASDPTLSCSVGVAATGETLYCCASASASADADADTDADADAPAACMADPTVTGCTGGAYGFSCTGSAAPDANDSSLSCSVGVAGIGDTLYCCVDGNLPASCMADPTVTGCTDGAYGFTCTDSSLPNANDPSLSCSVGVADTGGGTSYCCVAS